MTRILLVDDRTLICEILRTHLELEENLQVVGYAKDGQAAIDSIIALEPDVVLMDIEMPKMDGLKATRIIRDRYPQTKIIILSGNEDPTYLNKALQAGADGYLVKTCPAEAIVDTIGLVRQGDNQIEKLLLKPVTEVELTEGDPKQSKVETSLQPLSSQTNISDAQNEKQQSAIAAVTSPESSKKSLPIFSLVLGAFLMMILTSLPIFNRKSNTESFASSSNTASNPENIAASELITKTLPVEITTAVLQDSYRQNRFYTGQIVPRRTSTLSFEYSGKITDIAVEEGDKVSINTPLAYIDTRELEASQAELQAERSQLLAKLEELKAGARPETIAAAKATVRDLQEQLKLAQTKSERRASLFAEGAISREQLDENVTDKLAIEARLDEAQSKLDELLVGTRSEIIAAQRSAIAKVDAQLEKLQIQQEKQILKAPFAATVSARLVDEGAIVAADKPVLRLVENKALEARIGIPVDVAGGITPGSYQKLEIEGTIYEAQVTALLPEVAEKTRTLTAILNLEPGAAVFPGQIAKLNLSLSIPTSGYWLPTSALVEGSRGLWFCYVLGENVGEQVFTVERQEVEVLHTQSDRVFVRGTLEPGDRIITNGTHRVVIGQRVQPVASRPAIPRTFIEE